jgi:hypothetical protein
VRSTPEVLETIWGQLGVANRVLTVPVTQISLQCARVVAFISQREATGVPQHVRVSLEPQLSRRTSALDKPSKSRCREDAFS